MSVRKTKLCLHIGSPKTGSTALQTFLFSQQGELRKAGVLLSTKDLESGRGNAEFRRSVLRNKEGELDKIRAYYRSYFQELKESKNTGLIGTELLWPVPPKRLVEVYPELNDFDVTVIAVLRKQREMVLSHYKQNVKSGGVMSFEEFYKKNAKLYDYAKHTSEWEKYFHVKVLCYHDVRSIKGGIVQAIMIEIAKSMDMVASSKIHNIVSDYISDERAYSNVTLTDAHIYTIYAINKLDIPENDKETLRNAILQCRLAFKDVKVNTPFVSEKLIDELLRPLEEKSPYCK